MKNNDYGYWTALTILIVPLPDARFLYSQTLDITFYRTPKNTDPSHGKTEETPDSTQNPTNTPEETPPDDKPAAE